MASTAKHSSPIPKPLNDLHTIRAWPEGIPMPKAGAYQAGSKWTYDDEQLLRRYYPLYGAQYAARLLGRSMQAVAVRASKMGILGARAWTKQEIALLKRKYTAGSRKELGRELKRSAASIMEKARALGLVTTPRRWSKQDKEQLIALNGTLPIADIARRLGRTYGTVAGELQRLGLVNHRPPATAAVVRTIMKKIGRVSIKQIAQEVGMGMKRVATIARENGYQPQGQWWRNEWRPEEDAFLRKHYRTMEMTEIARHLGRLRIVVDNRREALGLPKEETYRSREVLWSKREDNLLRRLHPTMTIAEIATRLNRPARGVQHRAQTLGLRSKEYRKWTAKEDARLRKLHGTESYKEIAARLERSVNSVSVRAQTLGLTKEKPRVPYWTEQEDEQLRKLYGTQSAAKIAQRLDRSIGGVYRRCTVLGLRKRGTTASPRACYELFSLKMSVEGSVRPFA